MTKHGLLYLTGLLALICVGQATAEMYKWVDENGQVQYSQSPPPGGKAETVEPPPKVDTEQAVEELKAKEKGFDDRRKAEAKAAETDAKKEQDAAAKQKNCEAAKSNLEGMEAAPQKSFKTDAAGNRVRLTDDERQKTIADMKKIIARDCK
ncbi:MAG TPA: DUF4124 domain-containing protein [Gammaproteobacteria bacterium]|nr:DUF4124 domain-containing protein [Gammaproteobacteria bacterium]